MRRGGESECGRRGRRGILTILMSSSSSIAFNAAV